MFEYETLRIIWWGVLVLLALGFAITDGFDLGVGMLLQAIGKNDDERRALINAVGPIWEGNQVWLITLGGASFAAWPLVYATAFSGLYAGLLLLLFALILRPVGFDYRSKLEHPTWRALWDWALFLGGAVPALVLSLVVGNLFLGLPFHADRDAGVHFTGGFLDLFQPFALLVAFTGAALFVMHGGAYLQWRCVDILAERAGRATRIGALTFLIGFVAAGIWLMNGIEGFQITSAIVRDGVSSPLHKAVSKGAGLWLRNYSEVWWLFIAPLTGMAGAVIAIFSTGLRLPWLTFLASACAVTGAITTAAGSLFPFLLPSRTSLESSLTVWDASASQYTLVLLTIATMLLLPIVLLYTRWVYYVIWGKVTVEQIKEHSHTLY
jgi:cytochrome d ubiquinol oxidase subunit II